MSTVEEGSRFLVSDPVDAPCLCGGQVTASMGDDTTPPCVLHTAPACADFLKRDPVEFLRWLNERGAS